MGSFDVRFENRVRSVLKKLNFKVRKLNPSVMTGIPDFIVETEGGVPFCYLEVKGYENWSIGRYLKNKSYEKQIKFLREASSSFLLAYDGKTNEYWLYYFVEEDEGHAGVCYSSLTSCVASMLDLASKTAIHEVAKIANDYAEEVEIALEDNKDKRHKMVVEN